MNREETIYVYDPIDNKLEEFDTLKEVDKYVKENFIQDREIHPDIESICIMKKIAFVAIEDLEETGDGKDLCSVSIEEYTPSVIAISAELDQYYQECENTLKLIKEAVDNAVSNGKYTITELGIQERINKLNELKKTNRIL